MTDPFEHDDAAYVLGALSDEESRAFEAHLETCDDCVRRVAELRPVVARLDGVDASAFDPSDDPVPDTVLPGLLRRVQREQQRRRRLLGAVTALAAACVIALTVVLAWPGPHRDNGRPVAMHALVSSPVHATAALSSMTWGTRIVLSCHYDVPYPPGLDYTLIVVDKHGVAHDAGSWKLTPESVTNFTGGTAVSRDQIARLEITAGATPILELDV